MRRILQACLLASLLLAVNPPHARHGMDFLIVETPRIPDAGTGHVFVRQNYISTQRSIFQTEPGVLLGVTRWAALELPARLEKLQGRSARYNATVPTLHLRFDRAPQRLGLGVTAGYAIAHRDELRDRFESTISVSAETRRLLAAANLIYLKESGLSREWAYAAGARLNFGTRHGIGVELNGSLQSSGSTEALLGWYGRLSPNFTVNAGLGSGIERGPDWTARTAFIWRFR
jgi:hypothetical protein